jgi:hypothetical protein
MNNFFLPPSHRGHRGEEGERIFLVKQIFPFPFLCVLCGSVVKKIIHLGLFIRAYVFPIGSHVDPTSDSHSVTP